MFTPAEREAMTPDQRIEAQDRIARAYLENADRRDAARAEMQTKKPLWPRPWTCQGSWERAPVKPDYRINR
jgi:hypothetical protein